MDQVTYIKDKIRGSLMAASAGDAWVMLLSLSTNPQ